jgi:diguanylate cyclase (GGDEF)-like protein/PAS domain S-box-containing protein
MSEQSLRARSFRHLLDAAPDAVIIIDRLSSMVMVNREVERLFGWTESELLGRPLGFLIPPRFQRVLETGPVSGDESQQPPAKGHAVSLYARRRDGSEFPIEISRSPLGPGDGAPIVATIRDLTEWKRAQETLFREKEQASVTLASIADAVVTTEAAGAISYLNPTAERLTGWRMAEALGQPLDAVFPLITDGSREPIESVTARCLREGRAIDLVEGVLLLRRDGTEVAIGGSAAPLHDRNSATIGVVLVFHDVTEKRRVARALTHDATHDALTGLVSRKEFERRLSRVLAESADAAAEHALCYLDLDRFKPVNDICGHEAGDDLLRRISAILASHLRVRDTLARLGGDEFGVLLEHCSLAKAEAVAEGLRQASENFRYVRGEKSFPVGVSIGVVAIRAGSGGPDAVLRAADAACYIAKDAGGNRVHVAPSEETPATLQLVQSRRLTRLTRALDEDHFQLYVQRIVPLLPERAARPRCEILLRLPDESGGLLTPDSFLPHAERHRLMPAIDRWVVRHTVALVGQWHRDHPECALPLCSINLSASSLQDDNLIRAAQEYLAQHRLPPEAISFEITEAAALGDFARTVRLISEIRAAGCGVGLEDFGNGLTSFAYLRALVVDYVKISGHYVRGVADDPVYGTLVSTVNQIGRIMGLTTIAEDVETDAVLQKLRDLEVAYAQGHGVAAPEPLVDARGSVSLPCFHRSP